MPEALLIPFWMQRGRILQSKQGHDAHHSHQAAHQAKEGKEINLINNKPGNHRAEYGGEHGHNRQCASQLSPVMFIGNIRRPRPEAAVISHGAKKAHNRIRQHNACGRNEQRVLGYHFRSPENKGENSPENIPNADKRLSFPLPVSPGAHQECAECGNSSAHTHHPGHNRRLRRNFVINKGIEPGIFNIPADLPRHPQYPD